MVLIGLMKLGLVMLLLLVWFYQGVGWIIEKVAGPSLSHLGKEIESKIFGCYY